MAVSTAFNRRRHERFQLTPMYTSVTAIRREDSAETALTGHAYDISESGVRIELDEALSPGDVVEVHISVPSDCVEVAASGSVVRCYEADDDPGPRRAAVQFSRFRSPGDHQRLVRWLGSGHLQRAA